ncbi:MAG: hypothetical protein D6753_16865 [Planctomycetota bacterium]|nr:MAG: hypothetical protein D6753_16865 [Planctomycetota bacterium]
MGRAAGWIISPGARLTAVTASATPQVLKSTRVQTCARRLGHLPDLPTYPFNQTVLRMHLPRRFPFVRRALRRGVPSGLARRDGISLLLTVLLWLLVWLVPGCLEPGLAQGIGAAEHVVHWQQGFIESARIVGLEEGAAVFRTSSQDTQRDPSGQTERRIPLDALVGWGGWTGLQRQAAVWLIDGSWVCGELTITSGGDVQVASDWFDCPTIPVGLVRGIVFKPPYSLQNWLARWKDLARATGDTDAVWTTKGETLRGIVRWPAQESALRMFALESQGQSAELLLTEVEAIVYAPKLLGPVPRKRHGFSLALSDGSLLHCKTLQGGSGRNVQVVLDCGMELPSWVNAAQLARQVRGVFGYPPQVVWLSDLSPADYKFLSERSPRWDLGRDLDVYGRPLVAPDRGIVPTGLAMHAASRVAYRHDGRPARLRGEVLMAPPQSADQQLGSVVVQVLVAQQGRLRQADAVQLRRTQPATHLVDVDLSGVQLIVIVVDQWDYEQLGDHVAWLHARIDPP